MLREENSESSDESDMRIAHLAVESNTVDAADDGEEIEICGAIR